MPSPSSPRVLYTVVCAAPPACQIHDFIRAAQATGWTVHLALTPLAAEWLNIDHLARLTGHAVLTRYRRPDEPRAHPADALAVVPATFNTINKWAAGISDNLALGLLNEAIGLRLPTVVAPYAKDTLTAHPAFNRSLQLLSGCGIEVLRTNIIHLNEDTEAFTWAPVLDALPNPTTDASTTDAIEPR
jgi:phosphopantothenoylcysteine synthetase/decarboxylase